MWRFDGHGYHCQVDESPWGCLHIVPPSSEKQCHVARQMGAPCTVSALRSITPFDWNTRAKHFKNWDWLTTGKGLMECSEGHSNARRPGTSLFCCVRPPLRNALPPLACPQGTVPHESQPQ